MYLNSIVVDALPLSQEHISYLSAVFRYFFGDGKFVDYLLWLCVFDYITGWMKAFKLGNLKSHFAFVGLFKKIGIFLAVILGQFLDEILGANGLISYGVIVGFIAYEGSSLLENLALLGVPIFPWLKNKLGVLKDSAQNVGTKDEDQSSN
jgi:toxin secretion/phage lysis holin